MPELEFTGERVIPGLVDSNLFNEHFARYRFAARLAKDRMVLDAGCGSGYGSAQFVDARGVVAIDFSLEALQYARTHFAQPHSRFAQARCEALPFRAASFDLIIAFEVIEHLENWPALLTEASRVLTDSGLLLVSTPNKAYYAETRAAAGPNPFHAHEFEGEEFRSALLHVFPHVEIWRQNHTEAILLAQEATDYGEVAIGQAGEGQQDQPHFFLAVCSRSPIPPAPPFAWIPEAANVLREREHHIALLNDEVAKKTAWITAMEAEVNASRQVIVDRDSEVEQRNEWIRILQTDLNAWRESSLRLEQELQTLRRDSLAEIERLNAEIRTLHEGYQAKIASSEEEFAQTSQAYESLAGNLQTEVASLKRQLHELESDRLVQLGRRVGLIRADRRD